MSKLFAKVIIRRQKSQLADQDLQNVGPDLSDSFTILGLWVLGLAVSHIIESNCKLRSPEPYFS